MKETKLLGSLMPSHPDLKPIIDKLREKYNLPEISPDDDPIAEIYLGDEIIPLEDFRQEIENMVQESDIFLTPDHQLYKFYKKAKKKKDKPPKENIWLRLLPKRVKFQLIEFSQSVKPLLDYFVHVIDQQNKAIANLLYIYLLTGETEEAPRNWFSKVVPVDIDGETVIFAMASQVADPEIVIQQFREQYKKTFGEHKPKVTQTVVKWLFIEV